ncbi:uncharacterized protein N7483_006492 [Penicillium malachiteum]|uniref:uncharacterized protein n=1 Tax=Penicillium malachiteum TaxID=1324776 RepID=UPI002546EC89|nr:uncharacterized protein N7483_006492 [Penicillium malachiteum]KAJ5725135.1 hypothetical protein N7483_006492 [Penicillium malachiteum]
MPIIHSGSSQPVTFKYIANIPLWQSEKPYVIDQIPDIPEGSLSNLIYEDHESHSLHNLRGYEEGVNTFDNSFQFIKHPTKLTALAEEEMMVPYAEEINDLLKTIFKTDHVITYDLRSKAGKKGIAQTEQEVHPSRKLFKEPQGCISYCLNYHSRDGGWDRVARHLTDEELAKFKSGKWRARIVNVWRPLIPIVEDNPIAFLDPATVHDEDLVEVDRVSPISCGRMYNIKFNPAQKWYWINNQSSEEIAVFVCFDSHPPDGRFNYPGARSDAPIRQSVETRTIVFTLLP